MDSPFFFEKTRYWSEGDERCHFEWLARIASVGRVTGVGRRVYLEIDTAGMTPSDLLELRAVYRRYGGRLEQLECLTDLQVAL